MSGPDARVIDFAQAPVNQIADAITMLAEQIRFTNTHVERLHRGVGELRGEVGGLRTEMNARFAEMNARFDGVNQAFRDLGGEVILQANHIINAQQDAYVRSCVSMSWTVANSPSSKDLGRNNRIGSCSGQRSMVMAGLVPAICPTTGAA